MSSTSTLRLDVSDLDRLIRRFLPPAVPRFSTALEGDRLLLHLEEVRVSSLMPAFSATLEVKAAMAVGLRNVVAVHLQAQKLPLGLQAVANPILDKVVDWVLPKEASTFVEVHPPAVFWIHLERIPQHGPKIAEALTLLALAVPGGGCALEASFEVR